MKYTIQDREAGNGIDTVDSHEEAVAMLAVYEEEDKAEGIYVPNFYEIVEEEESGE